MSLSSFLRLFRRPTPKTHFNRPHLNERSRKSERRFTPDFLILEDRCLMAVFTPILPMEGTYQGKGLNSVVYTPEKDPGIKEADLPDKKLVTIENNSSSVVYPIFYGANATVDKTKGQVVRLELGLEGSGFNTGNKPELWPKVVIKNLTREIPEADRATAIVKVDGDGKLYGLELKSGGRGYQSGDQLEITFDDSANGDKGKGATAKAFISKYNETYALYNPKDGINQTYRGYVGEKNDAGQFELGLKPGHQATIQIPIAFWDGGRLYFATNGDVPLARADDPGNPLQNNTEWFYDSTQPSYVVAPSDPKKPEPYSANFPDPVTQEFNADAMVLWYHDPREAHDFGFGTPAQLTEMTFRDKKQFHIAPDMPARELDTIINYDVSYVDSLAMPASMEGTNVPLRNSLIPAPDLAPGQFAWLGSDMSVTEMQQYIAAFTTVNVAPKAGDPGPNGLGTYFGGLGYDQYYMPPDDAAGGNILAIRNLKDTPIQLIVPVAGALHEGSTIVIEGVKEGGQTELNGTWEITKVESSLTETNFFLKGIMGNGKNSSGGTYAAKSTGVQLQKLPAGYQVISDSENQNVQSGFDATKYSLVSGGTKANVETLGTGDATAGSAEIKNVNANQAALLVPGMLWSPVNTPGPKGKPYFPNGTTIAKIIPGTPGMNDATIVMTNPANFPRSKESWTFSGSQYVSKKGEIAAGDNTIIDLDPKIGIYLRPGMLVTGDQIPAGTYIDTAPGSISEDFKRIRLTKSIGTTQAKGPFTFTGEPYSYVVRKLVDVWYGWADYYVRQLNDSGPNKAPSGSFKGTTTANKGRDDQNSLLLKVTAGSFDMDLLRVGDIVTGTAGTLTPNTSNDPSLNYTITKINKTARTVELSLPVAATNPTEAEFSFAPPKYIVRSKDAPAAPGTEGTIAYKLDFANATDPEKKAALDFSRTVYDVMQSFSLLIDPETLMSRSALLLRYSIGGNVGSFTTNDEFADKTGRHTILPHERTHVELRDEIKSILRGVFNFLDPTVADPVNWYPDPAVPTSGATLDKGNGATPIDFGVYNLNPYVWFVHTQLKMSGYGFSLDDDVANTTANTNSIEVAFGGNAYTAPVDTTKTPPDPTAPDLVNLEAYTGGAKFGTQKSQGYIEGTSTREKPNFPGETRISGLALDVVLKLVASTNASDPIGAYITGVGVPAGATVVHYTPLLPINGKDQSWITFKTPDNWTPPKDDQPVTTITMTGFKTKLPENIVPTVLSAAPGSVVTINGKGFDGLLGVSFNGIPGILIADAISKIVNPDGGTITIETKNTRGLTNGDTITISGVTGQTSINRQWIVANVVDGKSFQLKDSKGNGMESKAGRWISATDSAVKVIVPKYKTNNDGTTYPGPSGKVSVRTPSGTNYSAHYFTIGNTGTPTFSGIGQPGSATASGSLLSVVTLYGTGFGGASAVIFNGSSSPINSFTANPAGTELKITIPAGSSGTGTFTITVGGTTYESTGYTFTVNAPVINASNPFSPASGPVGSIVTISGTGFTGADDPDTGSVTINGTKATNITVIDDKTITVRVSPGTTSGPVAVKTSAGSGNSGANAFTVTASQTPTVTSATPNQGAPGALIQLVGTNFTGVNQAGGSITFGGVAATVIKVVDDQNISVEVPLGANLGSAAIVVTNPGDLKSAPFAFTVIAPTKPVIDSFTPGAGSMGTHVTIKGSGFTKVSLVQFNRVQADFVVVNDAEIIATVPAGASTGLITAQNGLGTGESSTSFVIGVQPSIRSFSPDSGTVDTKVTIQGGGFSSVNHVRFNGVDARFEAVDDDTMFAWVPAGATTGRISMSTASGNAATSDKDFTVTTIVKPTIDSFSPEKGPIGTMVTIKGTGFIGTTRVTFNGAAASDFKVVDDKTITATVPNQATTGLIGVTNAADTGFSQKNFVVESADVPAAIAVVSGSGQSAPLNTAFAEPLKVKVTDSSGAALSGINVTFTAPTGGASGKFATGGTTVTVATDANGIATSPIFTANGVSGAYSVSANVTPALSTPAIFALTNTKADVNQTYIEALFLAFAKRKPTEAEMTQWLDVLNKSGRALAVDGIMRTTDASARVVESIFMRLLNSTAGDQSIWVNRLKNGESIDVVIAGIAGTDAFLKRAKVLYPSISDKEAFVKAVFSILMNREADSVTVASYVRKLNTLSREAVAKQIVVLPEFKTGAVRTFFGDPTLKPLPYQPFFPNLLQRKTAPTAKEISDYVNSGLSLSSIEAAIASSDEYFKLVTGSSAPASLASSGQARVVRRP